MPRRGTKRGTEGHTERDTEGHVGTRVTQTGCGRVQCRPERRVEFPRGRSCTGYEDREGACGPGHQARGETRTEGNPERQKKRKKREIDKEIER